MIAALDVVDVYCVEGDGRLASHERLLGMFEGVPVVELVCFECATEANEETK